MRKHIRIYDFDRTLSDPTHRLVLPEGVSQDCEHRGPTDFESNTICESCFHALPEEVIQTVMHPEAVAKDPPIDVALLHFSLSIDNGYDVQIVTARRKSLVFATMAWLRRHLSAGRRQAIIERGGITIHARNEDDRRPSHVVKIEAARHLLPFVGAWYDDDPKVIEELVAVGVPAYLAPHCFFPQGV